VIRGTLGFTHSGQALTPRYVALILDGEHGSGGAGEAQQVVLTEIREGLLGNPLQSVIEVVTGSCGDPCHHAWVGGVSWDVHVDLATSMPELTIRVAMVCRSLRVAETVEHVPEQSRKDGMVHPIATKPSVGPEGGIGVVIHLSKTREKEINISSIEQRQQTRTQNKPPQQHINSDSDSD
jgi:hypothetical protein